MKKYEPTVESQQELNEDDLELLGKIKAKYGAKLDKLYPFVVRNFITGYAHFGKNGKEAREQETYSRLDHYFARYEKYKFDTILDETLENEEEMFEAWKLYTYGVYITISTFYIIINHIRHTLNINY